MLAVALSVAASAVAGVFAFQLARQYRDRRRSHALAWALSLALFALASAAAAMGMGVGWSPAVFWVYWLAGALLTVPLLAVGQMLLMDPDRAVVYWTLGGLAVVWALSAAVLSTLDVAVLEAAGEARSIPLGEQALGGQLAYGLLRWTNYTAVIVIVGTVWSAITSRRPTILLIALGVVAAGASFAFIRSGQPSLFSATLAAGVGLMYVGFRAASKPSNARGAEG
ncbi:MAG TPA: hypothetical protein VML96_03830 [Egibacteraceae bacterium]|nr:hypothetical protein [Egibacteraceae bacterium]